MRGLLGSLGAGAADFYSCPSPADAAGCTKAQATVVGLTPDDAGGALLRVSYATPADPVKFHDHFHEVHLPQAAKLPRLRHISLAWNRQCTARSAPYLVATFAWASAGDLRAALGAGAIPAPAGSSVSR